MGLFRSIMEKLGLGEHSATAAGSAANPTPSAPASSSPPTSADAAPNQPQGSGQPAGGQQVDVAQHLDGLSKQHGEPLNWRTSIVDLLKLLGLDSSLTARKELAKELNYTGSTDDSAAMNTWLHAQVMKKLAENGGNVPADLLH